MQEKSSQDRGIPSPGRLLAEKREEYGWSTVDVAGALRLSERQIVAVEQDNYNDLPGKTYVMGYWNSYSQLLKIDIDDSIQIHRANLSPVAEDISLEPDHKQIRGIDEKSRKRAALLFGFLFSIFIFSIWYWQDPEASLSHWIDQGMEKFTEASSDPENNVDTEADEVSQQNENISNSVAAPDETESVLALPIPNFSEGQEAVEINTRGYQVLVADFPLSKSNLIYRQIEEVVVEPAIDIVEPPSPSTDDPDVQEAVVASDQVEVNDEPAKQVLVTEVKKEQTTSISQSSVAQVSASPNNTDSEIAFRVEKESWVDVRDSAGERLIYRTVNRGEDIKLTGTPPYSVFIGSAEGVIVQYRGKDVPFTVHESGLFARFEVGGN